MTQHLRALPIEKIVSGGLGLGRTPAGKVVLVSGVLEGELVDVQVFQEKKSYARAFVTAINEPSPLRITPRCEIASLCGGCSFQHIPYAEQSKIKQAIFVEEWQGLLKGTVPRPAITFVEAPSPFNYRQRIRLHLHDDDHCFYRHHSNKSIVVEQCPLAKESINYTLGDLESSLAYQDMRPHLREIVLHDNPHNNGCHLELFFKRKLRPADQKRLQRLLKLPRVNGLRAYGVSGELLLAIGDESVLSFTLDNDDGRFSFSVVPGDFYQVNLAQNQAMLSFIMARIDHTESKNVLDLFCGLGNFSIPLSCMGHQVVGMELKRSSIRSATKNSVANHTQCRFQRISAGKGVRGEIAQGEQYDIVILDPPRAGFKEGAKILADLSPQKIFYIACDQQTQRRDVEVIMSCGYLVTEICLVDMFPQTHHLESIVVLERSSSV